MENQLVTIKQANEIVALSTEDGVKGIVAQAKKAIHDLDGGSMKTAVGRKKIRSNAFKATKLKTSLKERSEELISSIEAKIAPELKTIKAIKDNQKTLGSDLDQLRKDVNLEVDAHEAELKRIEDEKAAELKAINDDKEKSLLWDFAISENELFDIKAKAEKEKLEAKQEAETTRLAQEKIDNDELIAKEAAEAATIEAERLAQKAIDDAQEEKQKAIDDKKQADEDLLASQAREKLLHEQAAAKKLNDEWLDYIAEAYEINDKLIAEAKQKQQQELAKQQQDDAIETERLAGIERQRVAKQKHDDEVEKRKANVEHNRKVNQAIVRVLVDNGITNDDAVKMVTLAVQEKLPQLTINY